MEKVSGTVDVAGKVYADGIAKHAGLGYEFDDLSIEFVWRSDWSNAISSRCGWECWKFRRGASHLTECFLLIDGRIGNVNMNVRAAEAKEVGL